MIARRRTKIVLAGLLLCLLVPAGGIARGEPAILVQLVGTSANEFACVHPTTPLLVDFSRRGGPSADHAACLAALLAELNKKKPPPAPPSGSGLTWYIGVNGSVEFMVESGSPTLPLTHGAFVIPYLGQWVGYFVVHASGIGTLAQFVAGASSTTASATSSAIASSAADATIVQTPVTNTGISQDLVGITEWTLTGLAADGSIDQLIVCAGTGRSKMLSLDRSSVPTPGDLVLPSTLSGGQLQRVGLARAIATSAAILVVDFPTGCVQRTDVSGLRGARGNPFR